MIHPSSYDAQPLVSMSLGSWILLLNCIFGFYDTGWLSPPLPHRQSQSSTQNQTATTEAGGQYSACHRFNFNSVQFSSVLISLCVVGAFESRHDMHQSATGKIRCWTKTPLQLSLSYPPPLSSQHGVCLFRYDSDLSWWLRLQYWLACRSIQSRTSARRVIWNSKFSHARRGPIKDRCRLIYLQASSWHHRVLPTNKTEYLTGIDWNKNLHDC